MQLDVLGSCLDELEMEVFAGSYVQIKVCADGDDHAGCIQWFFTLHPPPSTQPVVQAAVSASPQCNVTLCQGASGMLQPGDKAISGTFMVRGSDQVGSFFTLKPMQDEDEQHMLALLSLPLFGGASDEGDDCKVRDASWFASSVVGIPLAAVCVHADHALPSSSSQVVYEADSDVALHAAFMGMGFVSQSAG